MQSWPALNEAIRWREDGLTCVPLWWKTKMPFYPWTLWRNVQAPESLLRRWFTRPMINLAVVLRDRVLLVDFDDGDESWRNMPPTRTVQTARGVHLYYRMKLPIERNARFEHGDLKVNGFAAVPVSVHPTGVEYTWRNSGAIAEIDTLEDLGVKEIRMEVDAQQVGSHLLHDGASAVALVKASVTILDMLHLAGVREYYMHGNKLMCRCPFHDDKNPSMQVFRDEDAVYCHATGCCAHRKCDQITVFALAMRLSNSDAIREMAHRYV